MFAFSTVEIPSKLVAAEGKVLLLLICFFVHHNGTSRLEAIHLIMGRKKKNQRRYNASYVHALYHKIRFPPKWQKDLRK
jgi:hypothetical protein